MSLEYYKKQMVDLRARLQKEKDTKKTQTKYYNLYTQNQKNI